MHTGSGAHAEHSMTMHHMDQDAHAANTDVQSNCDCHCAIAGHCSGSMVGVLARGATIDFPLRTVALTTATGALATGYRNPPYRPPSTTA